MSVVAFPTQKVVIKTTPAERRKTKSDIQKAEYIEYRRWRALIQKEMMLYIKNGGTFKKASARTGLCATTISKLTSGETEFPRMDTMYRVLTFLGYKLLAVKVV